MLAATDREVVVIDVDRVANSETARERGVVASLLVFFIRPRCAALRSESVEQRSLEVGRHLSRRRLSQDARRLAIRLDERHASRTPVDVLLDGGAHVRREFALEVFHEQLDTRTADHVLHGATPAIPLRYPRTIMRARWTR